MAEVVNEFPRKLPAQEKWDLSPYLDGKIWKLRLGIDCHKTPNNVRSAFTWLAKSKGLRPSVVKGREGCVYVQATQQ